MTCLTATCEVFTLDKALMLLMTDGGQHYTPPELVEEIGDKIITLDKTGGGRLESLTVFGCSRCNGDREEGDLGYRGKDGKFHLDVRITGRRFFDGREFERMMIATGTPIYGGQVDDEHFLYLASDEISCDVISSDHIVLPHTVKTFTMTATLEEDINSGAPILPGLHFVYTANASTAVKSTSSGVGEVEITGKTYGSYIVECLYHKATAKYMELPIRYDSVNMCEGSTVTDDEYVGKTTVFDLGDVGLLSNWDNSVYDELECVSGTLTRRIGTLTIDESYEISEVIYAGVRCQMIKLKETIGSGTASLDWYVTDTPDMFAEFGDSIIVSPTRDAIYVHFSDEPDLEGAKEYIIGARLVYPLKTEVVTKLEQTVDAQLPTGITYVGVCSSILDVTLGLTYERED